MLVTPLVIFYEVGVLFTDVMNGADLITQNLVRVIGVRGFVLLQVGLLVLFIGLVVYLRRTQRFNFASIVPVLLESSVYAVTMGTAIVFLMVDVLHIRPGLAAGGPLARAGIADRLILSVGAGVHEELVFRLGLLSALIALFQRALGKKRWVAVTWAMLISSSLFSLTHHIVSLGEPFALGAFVYRLIAGLVFALLYYFRGFAIAVYTHSLYDIYVMLLR